jgi:exodeoxyribonuclease VII small subunit
MAKTITPIEEMDYEKALSELESITANLEAGKLSLEESMRLFERGQALASRCNHLLDQAELKIKSISPDASSQNDRLDGDEN